MKQFYSSLSAVCRPQSSGPVPVHSSHKKTLFTEKEKILERWAEHFDGVLNRPSTVNDDAINRLEQLQVNHQLNIPPSEEKVKKAICQVTNDKSPGSDAIAVKIYSAGSHQKTSKLTELYMAIPIQLIFSKTIQFLRLNIFPKLFYLIRPIFDFFKDF